MSKAFLTSRFTETFFTAAWERFLFLIPFELFPVPYYIASKTRRVTGTKFFFFASFAQSLMTVEVTTTADKYAFYL